MKIRWQYALPVVLLLVPFFYAMGFSFPVGDDFARSNAARCWFDIGKAFEEMGRCWWTWSGRYTHHFLVVFLGKGAESRFGYAFVSGLVSLLYWASLWGIFSELFGRARRGEAFFVSSVCMLGLYSGYSALPIAFYEITDLLGITVGNALVLTFIWALCALWNTEEISRKQRVAVFGSGIAAIGCYEHSAIATVLTAFAACGMAYYAGHRHKRFFRLVLVVIIAFFFISFFARGNFRRQTKRSVSLDQILDQLVAAFMVWKNHAFTVFASVFSLIALWLGVFARTGRRGGEKDVVAVSINDGRPTGRVSLTARRIAPVWYAAAGFVLLCLVTGGIVLVHAISDVPIVGASKLTASMALLAAYCVCFALIGVLAPLRSVLDGKGKALASVTWVLVTVALVSVLVCQPNYQRTMTSLLSGETAAFAASLEKRNAFLRWSGYSGDRSILPVSLVSLNPFPNRVSHSIPASPEEWPAKHVAEMFSLYRVHSAQPDTSAAYAKSVGAADAVSSVELAVGGSSAGSIVDVRLLKNVTGGANDTFRYHWLKLESTAGMPKQVYTKVLLHKQDWRPLLVVFQKKLEKQLLPHEKVTFDDMRKYAGIGSEWATDEWLVTPELARAELAGATVCMLPVAAPEWGRVKGVFISFDGNEYYRIPIEGER